MPAWVEGPVEASSIGSNDGTNEIRKRAVPTSNRVQQPNAAVAAAASHPPPLTATASDNSILSTVRKQMSFYALSVLSRAFAALFPSVQYVALPSDSLTLRSTPDRPASIHLYGEEYDIGQFAARHPGGSLVLQQLLGQDCTDVFAVHHPPRLVQQAKDVSDGQPARGMLGPLHKGRSSAFPAAGKRSAMQRDFDAIIRQLEVEGKFAPTPVYYITKAVILACVLATAVALILAANSHTARLADAAAATQPMQTALYNNTTATYFTTAQLSSSALPLPPSLLYSLVSAVLPSYSFLLYTVSALTIGMFWQQLAFLGHDAGHNQLTGSTRTDYVYAWLVTAFFGVSGSWWKRSHNVHHVHTNSIECDPDIQHLPMLAVSEDILKGFYSTYHQKTFTFDRVAQTFVRYQHLLYYPLMSIARANLYVQSFLLVLNPNVKVPHRRADLVALLLYWCWFVALMRLLPASFLLRFWYYMLSHAVVGLIHVQITLSHFAMPAYHGATMPDTLPVSSTTPHDLHRAIHNHAVDAAAGTIHNAELSEVDRFFHTQFSTTMNVDCSRWMDWLHGGLQFQVEHHLLPRLPRQHLRYAMERYIRPFAAKHRLPYHSYEFVAANKLVYQQLKQQANTMDKHADGQREQQPGEDSMLWQGVMAQG